jgi:hypothetical protein
MNQTRNAPWSNPRTQPLGFGNSAFLHEDFSREPNRKKMGKYKMEENQQTKERVGEENQAQNRCQKQ